MLNDWFDGLLGKHAGVKDQQMHSDSSHQEGHVGQPQTSH